MPVTAPDLIGVAHRVHRWASNRRSMVDLLFAILVAVASLAEIASDSALAGARDADLSAVVLLLVGATALIWRRRKPIVSLAVVTVVLCIFWASDYHWFVSVLGLPAIYSVAVHTDDRRRAWAAIGVAFSALVVMGSFTILNPDDGYAFGNAISMALYLGAAAAVGVVIRNRQRIFTDTQRRADQAEADRLIEAERAVANERSRIAREMHDVVAHGMSVISVQAAAAQEIARSNPDRTIHVAHCVEAGTPAELTISGEQQPLPPGLELAAFRIIQEALTNVVKHAGDKASATVELHYVPGALELTITDTGKGAASDLSESGGGNGQIGMRERADVYDGELSTGPKPGGGYQVRALLRHGANTTRPIIASSD